MSLGNIMTDALPCAGGNADSPHMNRKEPFPHPFCIFSSPWVSQAHQTRPRSGCYLCTSTWNNFLTKHATKLKKTRACA